MNSLVRYGRLAVIAGSFGAAFAVVAFRHSEPDEHLFGDVLALVSQRYVHPISNDSLMLKASRGLLDELGDPYAKLYTPAEMTEYTSTLLGHYGGVGMRMEDRDCAASVVQVFRNTPAAQAGLSAGDVIRAIDGESMVGKSLDDVVSKLRGPIGSSVHVTFAHDGTDNTAEIKRAEIKLPAIPYDMMIGNVGYIPLTSFNETSSDEMRQALADVKSKGAKSLILDLRGNGGGIVDEATAIADMFLKDNMTVLTQRERRDTIVYTTHDNDDAGNIPMVVLVDGYTASASEIVAGALQDYGRAAVLGQRTYGKGVVQTTFRAGNGNILKLTTGTWYTPKGRSIQKPVTPDSTHEGGITPDLKIANDTLDAAASAMLKAMKDSQRQLYLALTDQARIISKSHTLPIKITAADRDALYQNLMNRKVKLERPMFDAASDYIDYILAMQATDDAAGEAAAKRVAMTHDAVLKRALDLVQKSATPEALLTAARAAK